MLALVLAATLADPLPFDALAVAHARQLYGRVITITFTPVTSAYTWRGSTVVGPADQGDGVNAWAVRLVRRVREAALEFARRQHDDEFVRAVERLLSPARRVEEWAGWSPWRWLTAF